MISNAKSLARIFAVAMLAVAVTIITVPVSNARVNDDHDGLKRTTNNAKWKGECGACHVAYPPQMLPADSWRAIMSGLDKHFGSNAGMDAESVNEITAFLEENADAKKYKKTDKPLLRITETRRFKSEHREVAARHWKNTKVKSPANCGACHPKAEAGDFNEDDAKIPR